MPLFVLRRLLSFVLTLLATSVVVFAVLELLPGNAAQVILGETATPESIAAMEDKLGLNQPAATRYLSWMGGMLQGQTGLSISYDTPTAQLMAERMQVTLPLAVMAMGLTVALALALGIYAASQQNKVGDVRVRRALSHAIDKKAFIDGVFEGLAKPIGSHMAPTDAGYVDLTGAYAYDPEKAKALLKEAGVQTPLNVTLTLPPPPYARKGGEILAAQLAKVGIIAKIENVEWAQWLGGTFKGNFDLTVINHVEPLDYMAYANPQYYWGYDSKAFRDLAANHAATTGAKERTQLFGDMQRMITKDAVNVFLFNATNTAVYRKGLKGLWSSSPVFANDMSAVSWQ
ncbi:ABC transporter substrate-binding protein [Limnohabitans sp. Rim8]|uniref:ABC transporter substrate-binding protein n=1 Tax=Limnohabitans sp. Rim8 TaxID=1100718 RepID=UPI0025D66F64|nr:ABC transporter substrate-binding protein [Limnohabitans sp. Rim8]